MAGGCEQEIGQGKIKKMIPQQSNNHACTTWRKDFLSPSLPQRLESKLRRFGIRQRKSLAKFPTLWIRRRRDDDALPGFRECVNARVRHASAFQHSIRRFALSCRAGR